MIVSSRHETGPLVLLEAAVAGVPTVGTAVGHLVEWAPAGATSVPVGDWAGLADAIGLLIEHEDLRLRLARVAMQRAVAKMPTTLPHVFRNSMRPWSESPPRSKSLAFELEKVVIGEHWQGP